MEQLVSKYLRDIDLPVSRNYCEKLIASHPDYPSMLSIADTLQRLGIRHKAARIEKEHLNNIEYPYLLWPDENSGEPKIVRGDQDLLGNGTQDSSNKEAGEPTIVLKAKPADTITNEENNRQRLQDRFIRFLTGVLVATIGGLIFLNIPSSFTWVNTSLLLAALAGTVVGYLLIAKDVGISYKPVEAFCRGGKKTSCDALLNSEGARLFGDKVTFSDATASYFLFQLLVVGFLLPSGEASFLWILAGLSALTIPIIGYSFWYQAFEMKTWCRLCLIVDGLLIVQAALFGYILYYDGLAEAGYPRFISLVAVLLLFGAVSAGILLLKNKIKAANRAEQAKIAANRITNSPSVFMHLLRREKRMNTTSFEKELLIGEPDAPVKIIMAASLGCRPCKEGFEKANQLVQAYSREVSLRIRFLFSGANNGEVTPDRYLLHYWHKKIHGNQEESIHTKELLQTWYDLMNLERFKKEYPITLNGDGQEEGKKLIKRWEQWFEQVKINKTPTFFMNSYELPMGYRIEELMGLIPGIVEELPTSGMAGGMKNSSHATNK